MTVVKKIKSNTVKKPLEKTVQNIVKKKIIMYNKLRESTIITLYTSYK